MTGKQNHYSTRNFKLVRTVIIFLSFFAPLRNSLRLKSIVRTETEKIRLHRLAREKIFAFSETNKKVRNWNE